VAGSSAGAIVASLVATYQQAGRDLHELVEVMNQVEYRRFADGPVLERLAGRLGEGVELLLHEGAHSGNYLVDWLGPELEKAGGSVFRDLAIEDPSRRALVRLPLDYSQYNRTADGERVVDAVRASMSIPFYYR
jgi:NTE family protein